MATSGQQLAVHSFRVHDVRSIWKNMWAISCTVPFVSNASILGKRVLNHVGCRSQICRHNVVLRSKMWADEEIAEMDLNEAAGHKRSQASGKRRHYAEAPVDQLVGPLQPILLLGNDSSHHLLDWDIVFHSSWNLCFIPMHLARGLCLSFL